MAVAGQAGGAASSSSAGSGCCITATTSSLIAQGTATGVILAALVWVGVGLVGLFLLMLLAALLTALCSVLCCTTGCESSGGDCDCSGGDGGNCCGGGDGGSGGDGGGCCNDATDDTVSDPAGGAQEVGAGGLIALPATLFAARLVRRRVDLAHHPDRPEYDHDVYRIGATRLCIGCFTTYPVFLVAAALLFLVAPDVAWLPTLTAGIGLALAQGVSSLGLARTRTAKATVKTLLGTGLALFVYGVLVSPLHAVAQFALLGAALAAARLSTIPRRKRMRRAAATWLIAW